VGTGCPSGPRLAVPGITGHSNGRYAAAKAAAFALPMSGTSGTKGKDGIRPGLRETISAGIYSATTAKTGLTMSTSMSGRMIEFA